MTGFPIAAPFADSTSPSSPCAPFLSLSLVIEFSGVGETCSGFCSTAPRASCGAMQVKEAVSYTHLTLPTIYSV